jgi:hypothetical protein
VELVPGEITQPDIFVIPDGHYDQVRSWRDVTNLLLVV